MYFRDADACILVYDITEKQSFDNLSKVWLPDLKDKAPDNITIALVGNKADIAD